MKERFTNIQDAYDDMATNYQSFTKGSCEYNNDNNDIIVEETTIYRLVEIKKGQLSFYGNKFGGSSLHIVGNMLTVEKTTQSDNSLSEYRFLIEGREQPLILVACKKRA